MPWFITVVAHRHHVGPLWKRMAHGSPGRGRYSHTVLNERVARVWAREGDYSWSAIGTEPVNRKSALNAVARFACSAAWRIAVVAFSPGWIAA